MSKGELKLNRIKAANKGSLGLLARAFESDGVAARLPKIQSAMEARVERRAMMDTMTTLGKLTRRSGFDPTMSFQHVASIDNEIWQVILGMFGRFDENGDLMDDGLLYKFDPNYGQVRLNKDFFYAVVDFLEASGYPCDYRNKIKLT